MKPQIATTAEQGARLIACGVSADTADMIETRLGNLLNRTQDFPVDETKETLVWSLSRLLELMPKEIRDEIDRVYYFSIAKKLLSKEVYTVAYLQCCGINLARIRKTHESPIEACVQLIEWLMQNGYKLNEIK